MEHCDSCGRSFGDRQALQQHIRDTPLHSSAFRCLHCNRTFVSESARNQHIRDSPAHTIRYDCEPCGKAFGSQSALDQHLRDSPAHKIRYGCEPCGSSFVSQSALDQHLRDSPAHAATYDCESCSKAFGSQSALEQHIQYSRAHIAAPRTPLDMFFQSFTGFMYNQALPPSDSYTQLKRFRRWGDNDPEDKRAWKQYQSALELEVKMWFGAEDDLGAWHSLCRAIGIEPLPVTCGQAVKAIRGVFVNIIDLIAWARNGRTNNRVQRFPSLEKLREYTKRTNKVFSNNLDRDDDGNVVLRHLLRFIFRGATREHHW